MYWIRPICPVACTWDCESLAPYMLHCDEKTEIESQAAERRKEAIAIEQKIESTIPEQEQAFDPEKNPKETKEAEKTKETNTKEENTVKTEPLDLLALCQKRLWVAKKCQDPLFWSLYIAVYGYNEYMRVGRHNGKVEMEEKRKMASLCHTSGSKALNDQMAVKLTKVGCGRMAEELLTMPKTPPGALYAYAFYHKCSVYVVDLAKKTYLAYIHRDPSQRIVLYRHPDSKSYFIDTNEQLYTLEHLSLQFVCLESADKPLKSASAYKVAELETMAAQVGLTVPPKTRKDELYNMLVLHCIPTFC